MIAQRDYRAEYDQRRQQGYHRWSNVRLERCPACGFTYSDYFPKVETPVIVNAALLKRFCSRQAVTRGQAARRIQVGDGVQLCSGCFEQLIGGWIHNDAPLPERVGLEYETESRAYEDRHTVCPQCGRLKGYHGDVCVKCAAKRREERKRGNHSSATKRTTEKEIVTV